MQNQKAEETIDSKYIQQHLANERTYLAWIRTAIAMAGIGFVFLNVHFTLDVKMLPLGDLGVAGLGAFCFLLGIFTIAFATGDYLKKRRQINSQAFRSPASMVFILSISLSLVLLILLVSYFFL